MTTAFQSSAFQNNAFQIDVSVATGLVAPSLGGSKARKKIRGPYSDPLIYEQYIARCIAERNAPRVDVEAAILKESLIAEVEARRRTEYAERDALLRENMILERLIVKEDAKRTVQAIHARQHQIKKQIEEIEDNEAASLLALFEEMD